MPLNRDDFIRYQRSTKGPSWRARTAAHTNVRGGMRQAEVADELLMDFSKYLRIKGGDGPGNTRAAKLFPIVAAAERLNEDHEQTAALKLMVAADGNDQPAAPTHPPWKVTRAWPVGPRCPGPPAWVCGSINPTNPAHGIVAPIASRNCSRREPRRRLPYSTSVKLGCSLRMPHHRAPTGTGPGRGEVHRGEGGPVYGNGKEASLKRSTDNYSEARDAASGVTISISKNPDGSSDLSYTGKDRAHGVCTITPAGAEGAKADAASAPTPTPSGESHPAAERACLAAVADKTNVPAAKLKVIGSLGSEAGIQVKVSVPDADAPWDCMTDQKGKPWNVSYSGSEGKL